MTLIPFNDDLNRLTLKVKTATPGMYEVSWGESSSSFSSDELAAGINLAAEFPENPFCDAFDRVSEAVYKKQAYETEQIKNGFTAARLAMTSRQSSARQKPNDNRWPMRLRRRCSPSLTRLLSNP